MAAGHWVPEMVRLAGGQDVLGREGQPSERVEWARIAGTAPDVVVLMPCGFALERTVEEHDRTAWSPEWSGSQVTKKLDIHDTATLVRYAIRRGPDPTLSRPPPGISPVRHPEISPSHPGFPRLSAPTLKA